MDVQIETKRLILRDYVVSDWKDVHEYCADPEVVRFMLWGPNTPEQTKEFIERMMESQEEEPRTHFELAVVQKDRGKIIGGVGLRKISDRKMDGALGYCYSREVWGMGIASEAASAMLTFGFEQLSMHRIWATCDPENLGSSKVLQKIGMRLEGHFKQDDFIKDQWRDTLFFAILREEYDARNAIS